MTKDKILGFPYKTINSYDGCPMIFTMDCFNSKLLFFFSKEDEELKTIEYFISDITSEQEQLLLDNKITFKSIFSRDFYVILCDWNLESIKKIKQGNEEQREIIPEMFLFPEE